MKKLNLSSLMLLVVFLVAACASPSKILESGDYDRAIGLAVKRLEGKKNKKVAHVDALETAFQKATQRDMQIAESLKNQNRSENWDKINRIYKEIGRRQSLIEPLLPLYDKKGRKANFKFVKVDGLEFESREKAAEFRYEKAKVLLTEARGGNRFAARDAMVQLDEVKKYFSEYKDINRLREDAFRLGTTHVWIDVVNDTRQIMPAGFERALLDFPLRDDPQNWVSYHTEFQKGLEYHYKVELIMQNLLISPESIRERAYTDTKEIEDGFEYVLDVKGNVAKDTLGNDIKVPKKVTIKADVLENLQTKVATLSGQIRFVDLGTKKLMDSDPIRAETLFENYASTFRGDKRALTEDTKRRIGNQPMPFPTNETMVLQAAQQMKNVVADKVKYCRIIQ